MSKSYSYRKRITKLVNSNEVSPTRIPSYIGSISTGFKLLDQKELIYPTGLTIVAGKVHALDDLFLNLAWNCHVSVKPLKTCFISYHKSFEHLCTRFAAIETGAQVHGYPNNLHLSKEQFTKLKNDSTNEDYLRINTEPPLRMDDLISYMRSEFDDWTGVFFIDDLSAFIYDDWQIVLEKLHAFSAETQRPIILKKRTHCEEGEQDERRDLTYLNHPLYRLTCNHIINVTLPENHEVVDEKNVEFEVLIESFKDFGNHQFHSMIQDYSTGIIREK